MAVACVIRKDDFRTRAAREKFRRANAVYPRRNPVRSAGRDVRTVLYQTCLCIFCAAPVAKGSAASAAAAKIRSIAAPTIQSAQCAANSIHRRLLAKKDPTELAFTLLLEYFFVEYVRQQMYSRFGDDLYKQGYSIYTTLDLDMQQAAERALEEQLGRIEKLPGFHHETYKAYTESQLPPLRLFKFVSPGFMKTMGGTLIAGRDVTWTDAYEQRPVAMVSESLARELWNDPSAALGKHVRPYQNGAWREVVGVLSDMRDDGLNKKPATAVYWPLLTKAFTETPDSRPQLARGVTVGAGASGVAGRAQSPK